MVMLVIVQWLCAVCVGCNMHSHRYLDTRKKHEHTFGKGSEVKQEDGKKQQQQQKNHYVDRWKFRSIALYSGTGRGIAEAYHKFPFRKLICQMMLDEMSIRFFRSDLYIIHIRASVRLLYLYGRSQDNSRPKRFDGKSLSYHSHPLTNYIFIS